MSNLVGCSVPRGKIRPLINYVMERKSGTQKFIGTEESEYLGRPSIVIKFKGEDSAEDLNNIITSINEYLEQNPDYYLITEGYLIHVNYYGPSDSSQKGPLNEGNFASNYETGNLVTEDIMEGPCNQLIHLELSRNIGKLSDFKGMLDSIKHLEIAGSETDDYSTFESFEVLDTVVIRSKDVPEMIDKLNQMYPNIEFMDESMYEEMMLTLK